MLLSVLQNLRHEEELPIRLWGVRKGRVARKGWLGFVVAKNVAQFHGVDEWLDFVGVHFV